MIKNTSIERKTKTAFEFGEDTPHVVMRAAEEALHEALEMKMPTTSFKLTKKFLELFKIRLDDVDQMCDIFYCSECGRLMRSGFLIGGGDEYYCSADCLHKHYTHVEYLALYAGLDHTDKDVLEKVGKMTSDELDELSDINDSNTYYTDWE